MKSARRSRRKGVATTEFALVVPLFFVFILTMVEIGRGLMIINLMQHSARAACRSGIIPGTTSSNITATATDALKNQGITKPTITVKVNGTAGEAQTANSNDRITVVVSAPIADNTWLPVGRFIKGSISGQFTLARE